MTMLIFTIPTYEVRERFFEEAEPNPVDFAVEESLSAVIDFTDHTFQRLFETFWGWTCHPFEMYCVGWFNEHNLTAVVFSMNESYFFQFSDLSSYQEGCLGIQEIFAHP